MAPSSSSSSSSSSSASSSSSSLSSSSGSSSDNLRYYQYILQQQQLLLQQQQQKFSDTRTFSDGGIRVSNYDSLYRGSYGAFPPLPDLQPTRTSLVLSDSRNGPAPNYLSRDTNQAMDTTNRVIKNTSHMVKSKIDTAGTNTNRSHFFKFSKPSVILLCSITAMLLLLPLFLRPLPPPPLELLFLPLLIFFFLMCLACSAPKLENH